MPDNMGMNTDFEGANESSYSFKVISQGQIDLIRIVRENVNADAILIRASAKYFEDILYLSTGFLAGFKNSGPRVCGQALSPNWGTVAFNDPRYPEHTRWRCAFPNNAITEVLRQEIKAARAYKNAITVTVEVL
jgi:hypothetical protein